ncbi:hypothetical protein [Streptomyces sp. NBC_01506]|uniref:hypothetical protein n=1 Tax=Streptomyces sp. NBC_01506 TaxID=2903887 RepID=UPI00386A2C50
MDFEALHSASFKTLDDTVDGWTKMLRRLTDLKNDARDGLRGKANKANWAGFNATVSREFIGKTAEEFNDAYTQAESIRNIIRDTRGELKTQQRLLKEAIERGRANHMSVKPAGSGFTVTPNPDPKPANGQKDVNDLRDELQVILNTATEVDDTASTSLKALVDLTDYGFSGQKYADRDSAAKAIKEAENLARLAKKNPQDLTVKEFDALNAGLKKYSADELFAERFAEQLEAHGTLKFWEGINDPFGEIFNEREKQLGDLQKNLSLTLANATQADTPQMQRWKSEMTDLGSQPVNKNTNVPGFQVMSNLMRWGNYDDRFLSSYGSKLMEVEKTSSDNGAYEARRWSRGAGDPILNHSGTDLGSDPLVGFLKGLSNSPGAATEFFNDSFLTADEDHNFMTKEKGKEVRDSLSNFDYLFEERDWPRDVNAEGEDSTAGRNNLALALEAATTGHPAGELPTVDTPPHNDGQAQLMNSLVSSIGEDPGRLLDHSYMSDSVGQITSEYLPDVNRALSVDPASDNPADENKGESGNVDKLFPIAGASADLNSEHVTALLVGLGQNPEGSAAVETGQAAYLGNLMDYHLNPNLPAEDRYPQTAQDTIQEISRRSGEISGSLAIGRQEAILGPAGTEAKDFEDSIAQQKNAWSGSIGTGIGVGVSFIATPVGGAIAGGAASTVSSLVLEHLFQQSENNALQDAATDSAGLWSASKRLNLEMGQEAAFPAAKAHDLPYQNQVADWVRNGRDDGYSDASDNVSRMADHLTTEVPPA